MSEMSPGGIYGVSEPLTVDTLNVNTIKARTSSGLQIQDDGGNLGIQVADGGFVGIGGAPNAWRSTDDSLDINKTFSLTNTTASTNNSATISRNAYINTGGDWVRVNNDEAQRIQFRSDGGITVDYVAAGTGAIGWSTAIETYADGSVSMPVSATVPTIYGGSGVNDDITIASTSNTPSATSYVLLQPNGGSVAVGGTSAVSYPDGQIEIVGTIGLVSAAGSSPELNRWVMGVRPGGENGTYYIRDVVNSRTVFSMDSAGIITNAVGIKSNITEYSDNAAPAVGLMYGGGEFVMTAAAKTITLPAAAVGMRAVFTIVTAGVLTIDSNIADTFYLGGTALDPGDSIDSDGSSHASCEITCLQANKWIVRNCNGVWTDGGAS